MSSIRRHGPQPVSHSAPLSSSTPHPLPACGVSTHHLLTSRPNAPVFSPPGILSKGLVHPKLPMRFSLLGTGTSGAVPDIMCMTDPENGCECCRKTLEPSGIKNIRGNTGGVLRIPQADGTDCVILIDVGKTFREQAIKLFPKLGIRKIDAVFLTHLHADAIDGLDDLRPWISINPSIPIFCHQATYDHILEAFSYLVNKADASGSGFVPSFNWNVFPEDGTPLYVGGIKITPIPVHHGMYHTGHIRPLICCGFLIDSAILYMSDVSHIPETAWEMIATEVHIPAPPLSIEHIPTDRLPRLQALIIDGNGLPGCSSHFGIPQAVVTAHRLNPVRTYLTDIEHETSHECYLHTCIEIGKGRQAKEGLPNEVNSIVGGNAFPIDRPESFQMFPEADLLKDFDPTAEDYEVFTERTLEAIEAWAGGVVPPRWIRPACDGMTLFWRKEDNSKGHLDKGRLWDTEYHGV